jgi:S1-C subfamily serine protease
MENIHDHFHDDTDESAATRPQPAIPATPAPKRVQRLGMRALLVLALMIGALMGGAAGSALTAQWLAPATARASSVVMAQPVAQTTQTQNSVAGAVYKAASPSVVEITTTVQGNGPRFSSMSGTAIGSGIVIDASGLIITNDHVVSGAQTITVQFSTGATSSATVVGTDSSNDLALLRVSNMPSGIPAATLGDSSQVSVGDTAIAIGSPFGLEETVTQGIISALDRTYSTNGSTLTGLIQTDAPVNPGNSGGPLLNAQGQVIGINTMIESPVEGNVGVGFAVPINVVKQQLAQLKAGATLQQGYMGVSVQDTATGSQSGVMVASVQPGSGAAQAGIQAGDVITAIDGHAVTDYASLAAQISGKQPGTQVTVTIQRNGATQQVTVTLQAQTAS